MEVGVGRGLKFGWIRRASVAIKRKEAKEFPLKSRGWEFLHTCSQISGLINIFKLVSREVTTQQCVSIPASQALFAYFGHAPYTPCSHTFQCIFYQMLISGITKKKNLITNKTYDLLKWCLIWTIVKVIQTWWLYSGEHCTFFHSGIKTLFIIIFYMIILLSAGWVVHNVLNFWKFFLRSLKHLIIGAGYGDIQW